MLYTYVVVETYGLFMFEIWDIIGDVL